jgi:hypothetical protein
MNMGAKNQVIAGDYSGKKVKVTLGLLKISGLLKDIYIDKKTVEEYEIVDEKSQKSVVSAVGRGLVGGFLLGAPGLLAGLTAKSKGTHHVAIHFTDGKKSLLEVDDKLYAVLTKKLF